MSTIKSILCVVWWETKCTCSGSLMTMAALVLWKRLLKKVKMGRKRKIFTVVSGQIQPAISSCTLWQSELAMLAQVCSSSSAAVFSQLRYDKRQKAYIMSTESRKVIPLVRRSTKEFQVWSFQPAVSCISHTIILRVHYLPDNMTRSLWIDTMVIEIKRLRAVKTSWADNCRWQDHLNKELSLHYLELGRKDII